MKKSIILANFKRAMLMLSLMLAYAVSGFAIDTVELGEFKIGEQYTAVRGAITYGFIVAPQDGELTMAFERSTSQSFYSDPDCTNLIQGRSSNNFGAPGRSYNVTKGTTYYIKINNAINPDTWFVFYMDGIATQPFNVTYYAPQTNGETAYNLTTYDEFFVRYSRNVTSSYTVEMTYTSNGGSQITTTLSPAHTYYLNDYVYARMGEVLIPLLKNTDSDGISPGAPFTLRVKARDEAGQYAEEADADGWVSYSYTCGYIPTTVVSSTFPEEFLSYWPAGDPSGMASVTYDGPLRATPTPTVSLIMGNPEGELGVELYRSEFPARVEGNTVYVDFTGVRRTYDDILNGNNSYDNMTIQIGGLYDVNGQPVKSNLSGNIAKYVANLHFKNLEKTPVLSDWMPASGSMLENYNNIEVWISGINNIEFDGFTVEITNGTNTQNILVSMADVTVTDDFGTEAVYTFAVPAAAKTADAVKIYPTNLQALNGYDYTVYLTALFNTFTFIAVNPSQGADITTLEGEKVDAIFNFQQEYPDKYVTFYVKDLNSKPGSSDILVEEQPMTNVAGNYEITITDKARMYINHTYEGIFTAWATEADFNAGRQPIGTAAVTWYGASPVYQNSAAILEEIDPAEGTPLQDITGVFVVTFDSQVRIDESQSFYTPFMTEPQPFASITALGEDNSVSPEGLTYSTQWELVVPEQYVSEPYQELRITFVALDVDDKVVLGNVGEGEDSNFEFLYTSTVGVDAVEAEAADYTVYTLTGIRVLKSSDKNALRSLTPGIYIINGKKVKI